MDSIFTNNIHSSTRKENIDINAETRAYKREQFLDEKRRQLLRQNNEELRELERSLRTAYVTKELYEQKAEIERKKELERKSKRDEEIKLKNELLEIQNTFKVEEEQKMHQKEKFRETLQKQIMELNKRRLQKYEEAICENAEMQNLQRQFEEEINARNMDLEQRKEFAKQEMEDWKQKKEQSKLLDRIKNDIECEKLIRIQQQRDAEEQRLKSIRLRDLNQKQILTEKIGQQLYQAESEKKRREDVLQKLLIEECKAKEEYRYRQNLERQEIQRIQMREEQERHRSEVLRQKLERQKEEEEQMRAEQLKLLAERDKLDQLSDQRRRQKKIEHRREVEEMLNEIRCKRADQQMKKLIERDIELSNEQKKLQEIEDERIRILCKHSKDILQYVPAGVIKKTDIDFMGIMDNKKNNN